jgi:hypothetical protein
MRTIPLIARRAFSYHGKTVQPGELIQATPIEAVSLRYRGQARFAPKAIVDSKPHAVTPSAVVPTPAEPEPVSDFHEPEPVVEEPADLSSDGSPEPELEVPVRRRRSYKRRDLEAEG